MRQRNTVRIEETSAELDRLSGDFSAWVSDRNDSDKQGQYRTQLRTLAEVITQALASIASDVAATSPAEPTREVYARCRANDRRTVFVRRYWDYFRRKWDQRDDPRTAPLLRAAEEVIWSCYSQAFVGSPYGPGSAPLPYVEPSFSAHAIVRDEPPPDLRGSDPLLRKLLEALPVPVIGIPPSFAERPWWLVLLAHETGHHVQNDLADGALLGLVTDRLAAEARQAGDGVDADRWAGWGREVFADAFGVLSTGPALAWAIGELELDSDANMLVDRPAYPPPLIRLALMREVAGAAGLPTEAPLQPPAEARGRLAAARAVAQMLATTPLDGQRTLPRLCGWDSKRFHDDGAVASWSRQLRSTARIVPKRAVESARIAIAGAVAGWQTVAQIEDPDRRRAAQELLRDRVLDLVPKSRPRGERAARKPSTTDVSRVATAFAAALFSEEVAD